MEEESEARNESVTRVARRRASSRASDTEQDSAIRPVQATQQVRRLNEGLDNVTFPRPPQTADTISRQWPHSDPVPPTRSSVHSRASLMCNRPPKYYPAIRQVLRADNVGLLPLRQHQRTPSPLNQQRGPIVVHRLGGQKGLALVLGDNSRHLLHRTGQDNVADRLVFTCGSKNRRQPRRSLRCA